MKKKKNILGLLFCLSLLVVLATGYVHAEDVTVVPVNTGVTRVGTERNADLYQINLTTAGKLNIVLQHENLFNTKVFWTVQVLAADMEEELQTFDSVGTDENLKGPSLGLTAGTYYVKVYSRKECGHAYSDKPYTMVPSFVPSNNWEIEYNASTKSGNDNQGGATQMTTGKKMYGTIRNSNDVDYYKFTVKKSGYVQLKFNHPNVYLADNCWRVELINSKTQAICSIDSPGTKKSMSTPKIGVSAGTYYIKVTDGAKCDTSDYSVSVTYKKSSAWEQEYSDKTKKNNNSMPTANSLSLKKTIYGSISDQNDVDFYKINVKSAKRVSFKFSHDYVAKRSKYWSVSVYNSKLKQVYTFTSRGVDKSLTRKISLKKGTYFVQISRGTVWRKDPYKLKVS